MKKKRFALLLAVVMTLAALPVNLFGATYFPVNYNQSFVRDFGPKSGSVDAWQPWGGSTPTQRYVEDMKVAIDLNKFVRHVEPNVSTPGALLQLRIQLTGGMEFAGYGRSGMGYSGSNVDGAIGWLDWASAGVGDMPHYRGLASYTNTEKAAIEGGNYVTPEFLQWDGTTTGEPINYSLSVSDATNAVLTITTDAANQLDTLSFSRRFALISGIFVATPADGGTGGINLSSLDGTNFDTVLGLRPRPSNVRNITVNVADPIASETFLYLNELRISETNRRDFSFGFADGSASGIFTRITLLAPEGFTWLSPDDGQDIGAYATEASADNPYRHITRYGDSYIALDTGNAKYVKGSGYTALNSAADTSGRYLTVSLPLTKNDLSLAERISLFGLVLLAENNANFGDVSVKYAVDWVKGNSLVGSSLDRAWGEEGRIGSTWTRLVHTDAKDYLWSTFNAGTYAPVVTPPTPTPTPPPTTTPGGNNGNNGNSGGSSANSGGSTASNTVVSTPATDSNVSSVFVDTADRQPGEPVLAVVSLTAKESNKGVVSFNIKKATLTDAIKEAKAALKELPKDERASGATVTIAVDHSENATSVKAKLDNSALKMLTAANMGLVVESPLFSVELNAAALQEIVGSVTANLSLDIKPVTRLTGEAKALIGDYPVFDFSLKAGSKAVTLSEGTASLSVPFTLGGTMELLAVVEVFGNPQQVRYLDESDYSLDNNWLTWTGSPNGVYGIAPR